MYVTWMVHKINLYQNSHFFIFNYITNICIKRLDYFWVPKIVTWWIALRGSWWFQTSGGLFNWVLRTLLPMILMELGMGNMDGGWIWVLWRIRIGSLWMEWQIWIGMGWQIWMGVVDMDEGWEIWHIFWHGSKELKMRGQGFHYCKRWGSLPTSLKLLTNRIKCPPPDFYPPFPPLPH